MMPEPMSRTACSRARCRWLLSLGLLLLALPAAGCSLFEDEFTFLDRAAPANAKSPDAPFSAEITRP